MQMRTFLVLNAALALSCGGNDYSDYFIPTGADRTTSSTTNGTSAASTTTGTGGHGGASGTGGASSGGAGGSSGTGPSTTGGGSTGTGGLGGSTGSGGSGTAVDAGTGCRNAAAWAMGQPYMAGAVVKGVCMNAGGGSSMCDVGKTYLWTCKEGATCGIYAPGGDGWWAVWTVGMRCD
jgi:hypothetical protein